MWGHWVDYLKGIKEGYLGRQWQFDRECHGFTNLCGLVLWVTGGAGMGCEFVTLTQPVPVTQV